MKRLLYLFLLFVFLPAAAVWSQAVTNTGAERDIPADRYFRINYGNDYFTAEDYYLSQSIYIELVHPSLGKSPFYKIFHQPQGWESRYGMAIEHDAYTPVFYERREIQYGDRPFAGSLFLKTFYTATDPGRHQRLSAALSTGIVGQGAGGKQMQVFIHENTNNVIPQGWDNQIRNDVVLNYEVQYQKEFFAWQHLLSATADGMARLGTLSTKAGLGITVMAGYFNSPFASLKIKGNKLQLYAYDHPELSVVGYDATLQGGLFNRSSVYTIAAADVNRVVFRNNWGLVLRFGKLYLEYYQSFMTKEFRTGKDKRNGGIQIGFAF